MITEGSFEEGKFVALYGRDGRLRAVMAIGRPRQLMGFRPLLQNGASFDEALALASPDLGGFGGWRCLRRAERDALPVDGTAPQFRQLQCQMVAAIGRRGARLEDS